MAVTELLPVSRADQLQARLAEERWLFNPL